MDWTREEVEAIVEDYLHMLALELSGQQYNKAEHNRNLRIKLPSRTQGSIERKHSNISAVMRELEYPWIDGYKPLSHVQRGLLTDVAIARAPADRRIDEAALAAVEQPAFAPVLNDFSNVVAQAPVRKLRVSEALPIWNRIAVRRDYFQREAQNRLLGLAGEQFVVRLEQWRLRQDGCDQLADDVEHVSQTRGDGLGYDVRSFDSDGHERLIEVKTTAFGVKTPFFVTKGELSLSTERPDNFKLYRVFDFRKVPRLFTLNGAIEKHCELDPVTYRASFG